MAATTNSLLVKQFLELVNCSNEPVSDAQVRERFQDSYKHLPSVINELVAEGRVKIFQQGNKLSYSLISLEEAERLRGLSSDQRIILQEIEKNGNKGVWTRDIKIRTGIPQQTVTKTLRLLETRKLVKSVKSISNKNKKLYMLFDIVPAREITGGPWYNEQEFDHNFIDALSTFVFEVIKASGMASLKQIAEKVRASGISKVALGNDEVMSIINSLIYDFRIEEVRARTMPETNYKVSQELTTFNTLTDTPCGICPVFDQCEEGNTISPSTCIYMNKWLLLKETDF